jgi:hypothetical protein
MTRAAAARAALLALALAAAACRPGSGEHAPADDHGAAGAHGAEAAHPPPPQGPDPAALLTLRGETVVGRLGPGEKPFEVARRTMDAPAPTARRIGQRNFLLGLRTESPELGQYPCTSCHVAPQRLAPDRVDDAHRNLEATHPGTAAGQCSTCHAPDVERLRLQSGETVTIDHAYRLCAQCHFQQVEAWAGGAHGKRLDGWRGRRVVMQCTECHDPHQPTLEQRIPFRPPVLPRRGALRP